MPEPRQTATAAGIARGWAPRRLLVGYDGSGGSEDAVALGRTLTAAGAEQALLVHVRHFPEAPSIVYRMLDIDEQSQSPDFFDRAGSELSGLEVETRTYIGASPARVLHDLAEDQEVDLIVVGAPRPQLLDDAIAGSVAEALLHGAPVPVATAPRGYAGREEQRLRRIAVAYDATEEAQEALRHAASLARVSGATLDVPTVDRPHDPVGGILAYTLGLPDDPTSILRQARSELEPALRAGTSRVLHGPSAAAALCEACEQEVDLLCVGSRGYGGPTRVLLGSVTAELVRRAPCAVLVAPRPGTP